MAQTNIWEEWGGTILHKLNQGTEENSYWRQKRNNKTGTPFFRYVKGSTSTFEEIIWKIIKFRTNYWGIKPDWALAWVWGTVCGWVNIYCFIFEPYRGICGLSHKITISRKLDLSASVIALHKYQFYDTKEKLIKYLQYWCRLYMLYQLPTLIPIDLFQLLKYNAGNMKIIQNW